MSNSEDSQRIDAVDQRCKTTPQVLGHGGMNKWSIISTKATLREAIDDMQARLPDFAKVAALLACFLIAGLSAHATPGDIITPIGPSPSLSFLSTSGTTGPQVLSYLGAAPATVIQISGTGGNLSNSTTVVMYTGTAGGGTFLLPPANSSGTGTRITFIDAGGLVSSSNAIMVTDTNAGDAVVGGTNLQTANEVATFITNGTNSWGRAVVGVGGGGTGSGTAAAALSNLGALPAASGTATNLTVSSGTITGVGTGLTALNAANLTTGIVSATVGGAGTVTGILKANGAGAVTAAVGDTNYQLPIIMLTGTLVSGTTTFNNSLLTASNAFAQDRTTAAATKVAVSGTTATVTTSGSSSDVVTLFIAQ